MLFLVYGRLWYFNYGYIIFWPYKNTYTWWHKLQILSFIDLQSHTITEHKIYHYKNIVFTEYTIMI